MTSPAPRPEPADDGRPASAPADDSEHRTFVGRMTHDEYLRYDVGSERRYEYVRGAVYLMSGGTADHGAVIANLHGRLYALAAGAGCRTYTQGFGVRTPLDSTYLPDVVVSCAPPPPGRDLFITNPCLVVEVLSASTERTDTGEKLEGYQAIPELGAYLIVETRFRGVHRHWRDDEGAWRFEYIVGHGSMPLPCPTGGALTLDEIYAGVDLPAEPPAPRLRRVREPAPA